MKYYLSIDAGTSVIKTVIFDINFKQIISNKIDNPVITDSFDKSELNMKNFWDLTSKCIKLTIKKSKINNKKYCRCWNNWQYGWIMAYR